MNMDLDKKGTPEILIAPEHKPLQPPPKRPVPEMPPFFSMTQEQLLAFMTSALRLKYDPLRYMADQGYKARTDSVLLSGMVALMTHYLRTQEVNVDKLVGGSTSKLVI